MANQTANNLEPRPVPVSELTLGEPLPGALRDSYGRPLISAGTVLTQAILDRVARALRTRHRVYIGPDWPIETDGEPQSQAELQEQVVSSLKTQGLVTDWSEKRDAARYRWEGALTVGIEERDGLTVVKRDAEIDTIDISLSGMGFTHDQFLHDGTVIYVQFDMLAGQPVLRGEVRYCFAVDGFKHRVGMQFTPDD